MNPFFLLPHRLQSPAIPSLSHLSSLIVGLVSTALLFVHLQSQRHLSSPSCSQNSHPVLFLLCSCWLCSWLDLFSLPRTEEYGSRCRILPSPILFLVFSYIQSSSPRWGWGRPLVFLSSLEFAHVPRSLVRLCLAPCLSLGKEKKSCRFLATFSPSSSPSRSFHQLGRKEIHRFPRNLVGFRGLGIHSVLVELWWWRWWN